MLKNLKFIVSQRPIIIMFLIVNIIVKLFFFSKPFDFIDSVAFPDDTYISLYLAENISEGKGPFYEINYTNGFQPLYVFLCVPFYMLFDNDRIKPVYAALTLLLVFDCLSLIMIFKTVNLFTRNKFMILLPGLFWITSPYILLTSMNGLETIISFFFIVSSFFYFFKYRKNISNEESKRHIIILGILCGFAVFARIDNVILVLVVLLFVISGKIKNKKYFTDIFSSLSIFSISVIIVLIPWLIFSYYYTGEFYQSSGEGVRYQNWSLRNYFNLFSIEQLEMILYGIRVIIIKNISIIFTSGLCLILLAVNRRKFNFLELKNKLYDLLPLMMFCIILFCSYVFYIYGMWFFKRYFFPFVFLFTMILTVLIDNILSSAKNLKSGMKIIIILAVIIITINITRNDSQELYSSNKISDSGYLKIGEWVSNNFKEGTVIGSMQSGAMSYFARNLKVINLDGVVNQDAMTAIKNKNLFEYVKNMKIEYIIGWEINIDYLKRESAEFKNYDLIKIYTKSDFKTWDREWSVYKVNYDK